MCGVIFAFDKTSSNERLYQNSQAAIEKLKRRGPDHQRIYHRDNWVIGHTRLSIVDISSSHQPMISPDGNKYLSFNGEIYNYQQLRSQLEHHWNFSTNGDTEVILAGLIIHGNEFINHLDGMWAFLFWDSERQILLASRDPFGKKPLYFRNNIKGLYFSSELPALKQLDDSNWDENKKSTVSFLKYGFSEPGDTIYIDTFEVKPGHNLIWTNKSGITQKQYWQLSPSRNSNLAFIEACEQIEEKIETAVKKRLVADVEIAAFLSGGLDSSIISYLAQKNTKSKLGTYTVKFSEEGYDESKYAQLLAAHIGSRHHELLATSPNLETLLELQEKSIGQPFGDPSILPTYSLCKAAATHVKVALSGDGADEVFSGYQRYQARVLLKWYLNTPKYLRKPTEAIVKMLPDSFSHHSRSIIKKAKEFLKLSNSHEFNTCYLAPVILDGSLFKSPSHLDNIVHFPESSSGTTLEEMMYRDMLIYLPQDILTKVDRASMYCSLEVRSPFLDLDLVETSFSLPIAFHRSLFSGKKILKKIYSNKIPSQILNRKKQGFSNPIYKWFLGELGDDLVKFNDATDSVLSNRGIETMVAIHRSGKRDMSLPLWNTLSYLLWKKNNLQ